ncbi:MAG: hypothetical protein AABZ06_15105 [Bdellovibrionota bacterium]
MTSLKHSVLFLNALSSADRFRAIAAFAEKETLVHFVVRECGRVEFSQADGFLVRGRAVFIGDVIYVIVYCNNRPLTLEAFALLRRSWPRILALIRKHYPALSDDVIGSAQFIDENGNDVQV